MFTNYAILEAGQTISQREITFDALTVGNYRDSVGDTSEVFDGENRGNLVPPMAIAAYSLRTLLEELVIRPGTLHTGQEIEFNETITVGETLTCQATLSRNSVKGDWRFIVVNLSTTNEFGKIVMFGKSTIMVPENTA